MFVSGIYKDTSPDGLPDSFGWFARFVVEKFLPPLQDLEILWTVDPGRRSVLAHGHHSLCPGLLSGGLSAL